MVFNTFIKCQVCGSITRVRLQVGWQEEHPIVVACGKCGTSLSGSVKIGQDRPGLKFSFDNADEIPDAEADYMVECSGEFPTVKQGKAAELEEVVITPFIRYMNRMKTDDSYEQFGKAVSQLNATEKKWKSYKRIIDLFRSNSEYLVQEIQKEFSGQYFQCRDESEVLRAVHMIEVHGFYSALKKDILDNLSFSAGIMKLDSVQLKSLVDFLNSHDGYHLEELQDLIYKVYDDFIKIYQRLIPALALQYCKEDSFDFEVEGSTTSSFDNVKQFYLDVYEALGSSGKVFRINVEGSEAKHSFHKDGTDCSLYVFEAPIDLLSHITLYPAGWLEHSYVACCGTSVQPVLERLRQNLKLNMVYLCLDNDEAGEDACESMMEVLADMDVDVERLRPQGKDWNDDLCAKRGGHG